MNSEPTQLIFPASDANFESTVLERSAAIPVVVDFWAEWCGPCHALAPVLEGLVKEYGGRFVLAKVDIDRSPQLAGAFGVRSIPMVMGFRNGRALASFVGAQPESAIRQFLDRLLPSPAEEMVAEAGQLIERGDATAAETRLREALAIDPRCDAALLALAEIAHGSSRHDEALELLESIAPGTPQRPVADRLAAAIRVGTAAGGANETELRQRLAGDAGDHATRFALAQTLAAGSHYEEALAHYLEIVKRNRAFDDDAGRKAMLDLFDLLGNDHELTERYRSELAKVLFR
jgi:putative thioredoxin